MTDVAAAPAKRPAKQTENATVPAAQMVPMTRREPKQVMLKQGDLQEIGFGYIEMTAKMPAGVAFEEVYRPNFWAGVVNILKKNIAANLPFDRTGTIIHTHTEDGAYYALLYVRAVLERGLLVQCVGPAFDPKTGKACPVDLETGGPWLGARAVGNDAFELSWNGNKRGFDIVRKADMQIVADGANFPTRELAVEWINKTAKAH